MNTKTMLEREPFYDVLFESIREYFALVHGKQVDVKFDMTADAVKMYLYMVPLFASPRCTTKGMREFLYSEYNIRNCPVKFLIGKVGVFVVTHSLGLASHRRFYISPKRAIESPVFISPCNRSIRFYYFDTNIVDCIIKKGYRTDFLKSQLRFRRQYQYPFVPRVIDSGQNWYRESIMHGNALARITDQKLFLIAESQMMGCISMLATDTIEVVTAEKYIDRLQKDILEVATAMSSTAGKDMERLFRHLERKAPKQGYVIPTCMSHGDLQGGNVWVTKEKEIIIYDWETNGRRSVWYDLVTYHENLHAGVFAWERYEMAMSKPRVYQNDPYYAGPSDRCLCAAGIVYRENVLFYLLDIYQLRPEDAKRQYNILLERIMRNWSFNAV